MAIIIDDKVSIDETIRIFDSFYNIDLTVNASQYEIVYSFFFSISKNINIARNFTAFLFRIAQESNLNVMDLLEQLSPLSGEKMKVTKVIAYYLNNFKSRTSLYGVGMIPTPNFPVARNIVY